MAKVGLLWCQKSWRGSKSHIINIPPFCLLWKEGSQLIILDLIHLSSKIPQFTILFQPQMYQRIWKQWFLCWNSTAWNLNKGKKKKSISMWTVSPSVCPGFAEGCTEVWLTVKQSDQYLQISFQISRFLFIVLIPWTEDGYFFFLPDGFFLLCVFIHQVLDDNVVFDMSLQRSSVKKRNEIVQM